MAGKKLNKQDPVFNFLEQLVKVAIKKHITLEMEWLVEKDYFEDTWIAQQLHDDVEKTYCLQMADTKVKIELEDEDDPESLTCCYVKLDALDMLSEILMDHGIKPRIEVQVFNSCNGSSSSIFLSDKDVDVEISLLSVWINKPALNSGLFEELNQKFGSLI